MQNGFSLIIFDCDGVLVDSEIISCDTYAEVMTRAGFPLTSTDVHRRFLGRSLASAKQDLVNDTGRPMPADIDAQIQSAMAANLTRDLKPVPGIHEVVGQLAVPACVASSSAPERIRLSLTLTGLIDHLEPHIFSATQVANGKPAPDLFLFAARQMGAAPEHCLVIEDSIFGVMAGKAAGMTVAGFCGGSHCDTGWADQLTEAGADMVFADMREVSSLLATL